jgi:hypothetical protein
MGRKRVINPEELVRLINDELGSYAVCYGRELLGIHKCASADADGCNWIPEALAGPYTEESHWLFIFARVIRDFRRVYNVK